MLTYEYRCKQCGYEFEMFQSMTDAPLKICPMCEGEVERLIGTGGGLLFRGSGFYATDYRSDSYQKAAKSDTSATTTPTGSDTPPKAVSGAKCGTLE